MPTYRYKYTGLDINAVKKQVPPADAASVSAGDIASVVFWDITAPSTSKADLDEFLASEGWTFEATDPSTTPAEAAAQTDGLNWHEDEFVSTLGQVTFILTQAPINTNSFSLTVNGVVYDDVSDYTVSGTTLTWLNTLFSLEAGDKLLARYQ